jgi:hypothetical protein
LQGGRRVTGDEGSPGHNIRVFRGSGHKHLCAGVDECADLAPASVACLTCSSA